MIHTLPARPTFGQLGGSKADYVDGVIDPNTDRTSDEVNALVALASASAAVQPMLVFGFFGGSPVSVFPTVLCALAGVTIAGVKNSTGNYSFTLPNHVADLQGNAQTWSPSFAFATAIVNPVFIACQIVNNSTTILLNVLCQTASGTPIDPVGVNVMVF